MKYFAIMLNGKYLSGIAYMAQNKPAWTTNRNLAYVYTEDEAVKIANELNAEVVQL